MFSKFSNSEFIDDYHMYFYDDWDKNRINEIKNLDDDEVLFIYMKTFFIVYDFGKFDILNEYELLLL